MTLNELLIIKAAYKNYTMRTKAFEIIERELKIKEIERAHPMEPHVHTYGMDGVPNCGCDLPHRRSDGSIKYTKREHQWEFYMNGSFCKICNAQLGDGTECK